MFEFISLNNIVALWFFTPIIVGGLTFPLIAFHFHRWSVIGPVSNWIVGPYMSVIILPMAYGISLLSLISSFFFEWSMPVMHLLFQILLWLVNFFGSSSWSTIWGWCPGITEFIFYYGGLFFMVLYIRKKDWIRSILIGITVGLSLFLSNQFCELIRSHDPRLHISFLSVGQGDSTLVTLPNGKTLLIDGGGMIGFDVGERLLASYLWRNKVSKIDILVLTHSDYDHIQGFSFILDHFPVGEIWLSQWQSKNKIFYEVIGKAEAKNIPCYLKKSGDSSIVSGVSFNFLNPRVHVSNQKSQKKSNDQSLVFKMNFKNKSFLFTGDIESSVERELAAVDLSSTILKVPHHGSKTSSSEEFLKKVNPELAVMSLGFQNRYHFPDPRVLKRYEEFGIRVWRTDIHGTLCLSP